LIVNSLEVSDSSYPSDCNIARAQAVLGGYIQVPFQSSRLHGKVVFVAAPDVERHAFWRRR
jgi:hypothetical protein